MKTLVFGKLADIIGHKEVEIEDVEDVAAVRVWLENRFPDLNGMQYAVAVNQVLANEGTKLKTGDVVALLPPFSGG